MSALPKSLAMLPEAIEALKDAIRSSGYVDGVVEEVAEEYEVNPVLLRRKFTDATGCKPEDYRVTDTSALSLARAKQLAEEWGKSFTGGSYKLCGLEFRVETFHYVAVAWTSQGLHVIRVENGARMILTFKNQQAARNFIAKNVI